MQQGKPGTPLVYEVFDVLEIDGEPLTGPAADRAPRAARGARRSRRASIQVSGVFDDGEALFEAAKEQELEGVMAKKAASRYQEGKRGGDWLKIKTHGRQEFVICGWTKGQGRRAGTLRLARPRRPQGQGVRLGRERRHRLQRARRSTSSSRSSGRSSARRRRSRSSRRCRRSARATSSGSSRSSSARSSSSSGRTTATCARRRSRGCATTSLRKPSAGKSPAEMTDDAGLKLSNLDKLFWPATTRAARSRKATSSTTTAQSRPCSSRI